MEYSIGVMQGRLTAPKGRGIQFFPFDNWENEFIIASEIGLNEIEFIFDFDRYEDNPLWSQFGREKIKKIISASGVKVNHICADFFMRSPFFRVDTLTNKHNIDILKRLIEFSAQIGAYTIEIPLVDNSSIKNEAEKNILRESLYDVLPLASSVGIIIGLETDLAPPLFTNLLEDIKHPLIKANYDSGNSSGLGFDPDEEITSLGNYLHNVHIKDRLIGGTTVLLGSGSANFDRLFNAFKKVNYKGSFILQAARDVEGDEKNLIKKYMNFVNGYIKKYL